MSFIDSRSFDVGFGYIIYAVRIISRRLSLEKCGFLDCVLVKVFCTVCWKFFSGVWCWVYMEYMEFVVTVWGFLKGGSRVFLEGWGVKGRIAAVGGFFCLDFGVRVWFWFIVGASGVSRIFGCCFVGFGLFFTDVIVVDNCWGFLFGLTFDGDWLVCLK